MPRRRLVSCALGLAWGLVGTASAQEPESRQTSAPTGAYACSGFRTHGGLLGTLADARSGAPVPGASVRILARDAETGSPAIDVEWPVDPSGEFQLCGLPLPALYEIRPVAPGFEGRGVVFDWEEDRDVHVHLELRPVRGVRSGVAGFPRRSAAGPESDR